MKNKKYSQKSIFASLKGEWRFKRNIIQQKGGLLSFATGDIKFLKYKDDKQLLYKERGDYYLNPKDRLKFSKGYQYILIDQNILIYFLDHFERKGNLFMSLSFKPEDDCVWIAESEHICSNDQYKGKFKIKFHKHQILYFIISFSVKGPNKDYESITYIFS